MATALIGELFAQDVHRNIEEVIKVDQTDEQIIRDELSEYVLTNSIRAHFTEILERYWETPKRPHEGIGVWVSGFFGSGKSSFAKYLGLALEDRSVRGEGAAELLGRRTDDDKLRVLLTSIAEHIPTDAVIFDVSTDRGIRTGNQTMTEIVYRQLLDRLGYARDLDLSELEITLEGEGRLDEFEAKFQEVFAKDWNVEKGKIALAVQQASRVMHELDASTYATVDSWRESAMRRADISANLLADRCGELMKRRGSDRNLIFVVDEVGQFVARDVQKMLDLQGVVQALGRAGRGKLWLIVTSQEKLSELVGGLDDTRVELARLMDRSPLQVHLEPSDISEVTSRRVLAKNGDAERMLRELFGQHRGRLTESARLSADVRLPELSTEAFADLYPLLPYQIDLIISVVSGLRTASGASKHVGGANRTVIKLAQQLLVHPGIDLASQPVGALARIDQVYDLVSANIPSELRGKISDIGRGVDHPLAEPVAKAICLLQYVQSVHRTAENIAATLHPSLDADSRLPEVKAALDTLERAHMIRLGDEGYRIPSPAEDDWERQRSGFAPRPGDVHRLHAEVVAALWQPQPSHRLLDVRLFKAALSVGGREIVQGDIAFHLSLPDAGSAYDGEVEEARKRSQTEASTAFWVAPLSETIDRETVEVFRSREILSRKERDAQTKDEAQLVAEERGRMRRHQDELRRLLKQALASGTIFFRGNDRSPGDSTTEVHTAAASVLAQALPQVFDRFADAGARVAAKDLDSILTNENLNGLTPVFSTLNLVRDEGGKSVFNTDSGPLAEILGRIENRANFGDATDGRYLSDELAKEPYGWEFDAVQLFVASLLRAGKITVTSKGRSIDSALSLDARTTFSNNNLFRQASFRPKVGLDFPKIVDASAHFKDVFGKDLGELEQSAVASAIREELQRQEQGLSDAHRLLEHQRLPGVEILSDGLDQMRGIRQGPEDQAILAFSAVHRELKEAIKRAAELTQALSEPRLVDLRRATTALGDTWRFLTGEHDLPEDCREQAELLKDLMGKETFFRELPTIEQLTRVIETEYAQRHAAAVEARVAAYGTAVEQLRGTPGWEALDPDQQARISETLVARSKKEGCDVEPVPMLREQTNACPALLDRAVEELLRFVDGNRVVPVEASSYFAGGIETEEQLDQAIVGLRERCLELIGAGKKVLVR